jgi:hypothetical protein
MRLGLAVAVCVMSVRNNNQGSCCLSLKGAPSGGRRVRKVTELD